MSGFDKQTKERPHRGVDRDKQLSNRREAAVTLRQKKKYNVIQEKRGRMLDGSAKEDAAKATLVDASQLPEFILRLQSPDTPVVQEAIKEFRILLSREEEPPINTVLETPGCMQAIIALLKRDDATAVQFEAIWALTNIAAGTHEQCTALVQTGALPDMIRLADSTMDDVKTQALWALANIAGDGPELRDLLVQRGCMQQAINIIHQCVSGPSDDPSRLQTATWLMSNLIRGKPVPALEVVMPTLPVARALLDHPDQAVAMDAAWTLSYASDANNEQIDLVLAQQPLASLMKLLIQQDIKIVVPALRCLGNIVTGTPTQTQQVIDAGVLPALHHLLSHQATPVRKECCWMLSNIAAGPVAHIQAIIGNSLVPCVVNALNAQEFEVRKEACWIVANMTLGATAEQVAFIVGNGALDALVQQLHCPHPKILVVTLEALENILNTGEQAEQPEFKQRFQQLGGVDQLEGLQEHESDEVYRLAGKLLIMFFGASDVAAEEEVSGPVPPQPGM